MSTNQNTFTPAEKSETPADVEWELAAGDDSQNVEVVDDTPEKDRGRRVLDYAVADPTEEELQAYSDGVKKRIKELTHARHDERRAKEALLREKTELERVARAMMDENQQLRQYVQSGSTEYGRAITSAAESELAMAKQRYKDAYDSGDSDKLLAAQEAITDAKLKLSGAKNFRPAPLQPAPAVAQSPQTLADEKTLRWQAKNQWFMAPGYEEVTSFSLGLHQKLVNSGVDPRSDEYFERIDSRLRTVFPEMFNDAKPKPASVVAPVTRTTGTRKVQLTTTQVALAKRLGITPQQYAAEMAKLENPNG